MCIRDSSAENNQQEVRNNVAVPPKHTRLSLIHISWGDMEDEMRREGLLLYGLESGDPISDFDIIGFSLGYEMAYSNVLNMLDLAGLPLRSADRPELTPLIVAGGTCAYNPEPLAPFIDLFVVGEGEEVTLEYVQLYRQAREECWSKEEFLQEAARIPGRCV